MNYLHSEITAKILKAYYNVYNNLGYGFLEKVYENAMMIELDDMFLYFENQKPIKVKYKNKIIGEYYADIVVDNKVVIELKAVESLSSIHEVQLFNYLRATDLEVGMILNFGKKPEHIRRVLTNDNKHNFCK